MSANSWRWLRWFSPPPRTDQFDFVAVKPCTSFVCVALCFAAGEVAFGTLTNSQIPLHHSTCQSNCHHTSCPSGDRSLRGLEAHASGVRKSNSNLCWLQWVFPPLRTDQFCFVVVKPCTSFTCTNILFCNEVLTRPIFTDSYRNFGLSWETSPQTDSTPEASNRSGTRRIE